MKRVVISGLGIVSCLGNNQEEVYQSLLNGKSGISFCEEYTEYNLKSHIHGKPNIKLEVAVIKECSLNWCNVTNNLFSGWVEKNSLWGLNKNEIMN